MARSLTKPTKGCQGLLGVPVVLDQAEDKAAEVDAPGNQRAQTGEDRNVTLEKLEATAAFHHYGVRSFDLYQGREHVIEELLAMDNGHQQPHSVSLQTRQGVEELGPVGGGDQRFEGIPAPRQAGEAGETGEVVGRGVGIAEETENEVHGLFVQCRVVKPPGVGRDRHRQPPQTRNLGVGHGNAATDARGEDRLPFEQALHDNLYGVHQASLVKNLPEPVEELLPPVHFWGNQHHLRVESLG